MKRKLLFLLITLAAFALGVSTHRMFTKRTMTPTPETKVTEQRATHRCTAKYYNQAENYDTFDAYCFGLQAKLYHEAWAGNVEVMKRVLSDGANPDSYSGEFLPPLLVAAGGGHTEAVRLLVDNGADVNRVWSAGVTPMTWAVGNGHTEIVKILISHGANVNARDHDGSSVMEIARRDKHEDIVELLKRSGAE
jgi:ankyrin repeat protein